MKLVRSMAAVWAALGVCAGSVLGQGAAPPGAGAAQALPPGVLLGQRAAGVDLASAALSVVEIAPDTGAFVAALGRWSFERGSWPVLIDDGTDRAREDIARFVRAYQPEKVIRLPAAGGADEAELEARASMLLRTMWGAREGQPVEARWEELKFRPAGVVVANAADPAWTGALALSLGRGQPVAWVLGEIGAPGGQTTPEAVHEIERQVGAFLRETPWTFQGLGDDIDAVTACFSIGGRVVREGDSKGPLALTDVLGRAAGKRWAWAGWIFGSSADAAYMAMSSLFIPVRSGWMFDTYGAGFPEQYACAKATPLFEAMKYPVQQTTPPAASLGTWRLRSLGGIDAGIVQVNTMGHFNWFRIGDINAWASEVPMLVRPALVSFTHSFSAQYVNAPSSISGRWLEEGAMGYIGSVDEPGLGAFVPPSVLFNRLFHGGAWGYAPRLDGAEAWKVQVVGDPLKTCGPERPRAAGAGKEVEGAEELTEVMKQAMEARRLGAATSALVMLGRDADAVRVARAALADEKVDAKEKAAVARAALRAAFRERDAALFVRLYEVLPEDVAKRDGERALLWQIARPELESGEPDAELVLVLLKHIRPESAVDDAGALREFVDRVQGPGSAAAMYQRLIEQAPNEAAKQALMRAAGGAR